EVFKTIHQLHRPCSKHSLQPLKGREFSKRTARLQRTIAERAQAAEPLRHKLVECSRGEVLFAVPRAMQRQLDQVVRIATAGRDAPIAKSLVSFPRHSCDDTIQQLPGRLVSKRT